MGGAVLDGPDERWLWGILQWSLTSAPSTRDHSLATFVLSVEPLYLIGDPQELTDVWKKLADQF